VKHETILYISDHATNSDSVIIELEATGYDVVSTAVQQRASRCCTSCIQLLVSYFFANR
jgi:hypothetical protein